VPATKDDAALLTHLQIRNLAVLDEVELELGQGFTALTGETGAGKSMLVDALALALGERADSSAVRSGADRAEINASFDISSRADISVWLQERDFDASADCQLRRVVTSEGRSRGYLNGQSVPLETLRDLGEQLVEICGQHAHQSLRQRGAQRALLDAHGRHDALLGAMSAAHAAWSAVEAERDALSNATQDREARRELLAHQVRELTALNLQPGESEALELEHRLLANRERIATGLNTVLLRLHDAEQSSAQDTVGVSRRELDVLARLDPLLEPATDLLQQAAVQIQEAAEMIRRRLAALEHDPAHQTEVESRLATVQELARKHRIRPDELPARTALLMAELERLTGSDARLEQLGQQASRLRREMLTAAAQLSRARQAAASSFAAAVTAHLRKLGMPHAEFQVHLAAAPEHQLSAAGAEQVEFMATTNAGQSVGPVTRVASGGELSRLSLAIQAVAMTAHGTPTLIFDEVDAGIGGGVAEIVGQSLKTLSHARQVLCVTHLPQVASQAQQHIVISKISAGGTTRTTIRHLKGRERVEEIARMLGGLKITDRTRAHAREMLASAERRRAG
jgi:DNA repair protein RecN (Recombination protein N)